MQFNPILLIKKIRDGSLHEIDLQEAFESPNAFINQLSS
jgi:hypothetical protein